MAKDAQGKVVFCDPQGAGVQADQRRLMEGGKCVVDGKTFDDLRACPRQAKHNLATSAGK